MTDKGAKTNALDWLSQFGQLPAELLPLGFGAPTVGKLSSLPEMTLPFSRVQTPSGKCFFVVLFALILSGWYESTFCGHLQTETYFLLEAAMQNADQDTLHFRKLHCQKKLYCLMTSINTAKPYLNSIQAIPKYS